MFDCKLRQCVLIDLGKWRYPEEGIMDDITFSIFLSIIHNRRKSAFEGLLYSLMAGWSILRRCVVVVFRAEMFVGFMASATVADTAFALARDLRKDGCKERPRESLVHRAGLHCVLRDARCGSSCDGPWSETARFDPWNVGGVSGIWGNIGIVSLWSKDCTWRVDDYPVKQRCLDRPCISQPSAYARLQALRNLKPSARGTVSKDTFDDKIMIAEFPAPFSSVSLSSNSYMAIPTSFTP